MDGVGSPPRMTTLAPDLAFVDGALRRDVRVRVGADGLIEAVGSPGLLPPAGPVMRLPGKVLLPGFVNAHSHAFQRVLRGRTEYAERTGGDDFWTWRAAMYGAANRLTPEEIEVVSRLAYIEMLRAGYTHVAEFHYLHHQPDGTPYAEPLELTRRVLAAAASAGIGITLLRVAYQRGGPGIPASFDQRRFVDPSPEAYAEALAATLALTAPQARRPVLAGIAAHSVRALDRTWLAALAALPAPVLHAHVAEHPREIAECLAEHGLRPVQLLAELGMLSPRFVAVHATHLDPSEIALLGGAGAIACICPTTERNLGDGLPAVRDLLDAGARLAIGSDSHAVIDPFAEIAALENGERLRTGRRNVLVGGSGRHAGIATTLLTAGSDGGRAASGLPPAGIRRGARADLVTVDLSSPQLAGVGVGAHGDPSLLAALALAGNASMVRDVWVGGTEVVRDGHHAGWESALRAYEVLVGRMG